MYTIHQAFVNGLMIGLLIGFCAGILLIVLARAGGHPPKPRGREELAVPKREPKPATEFYRQRFEIAPRKRA